MTVPPIKPKVVNHGPVRLYKREGETMGNSVNEILNKILDENESENKHSTFHELCACHYHIKDLCDSLKFACEVLLKTNQLGSYRSIHATLSKNPPREEGKGL
jgi:hypothetical protein